jgi:putative oligomerization/nucleic acid binding protein
MMMRRRRPLLGAAMIGGAAYHAGKRGQENAQREADQQARIDALEAQQYQQPQYAAPPPPPAPAAAPAGGGSDLASQLANLKQLADQGVLTPEEFNAAKQKLLAG